MLKKHRNVFAKSETDLGCTDRITHRIRLIDDNPVNKPHRRIAPGQIKEVKEHIDILLESGVIIESQSSYASPVVVVGKKDGFLRL